MYLCKQFLATSTYFQYEYCNSINKLYYIIFVFKPDVIMTLPSVIVIERVYSNYEIKCFNLFIPAIDFVNRTTVVTSKPITVDNTPPEKYNKLIDVGGRHIMTSNIKIWYVYIYFYQDCFQ